MKLLFSIFAALAVVGVQGQLIEEIHRDIADLQSDCMCGWKKTNKRDLITRGAQIVGGQETGINEFPFMAGLVDAVNKQIYCGGTIISQQYILTAAHCVENRNINTFGVVVGEHDVTTDKETHATKLYRLNSCTIHPKYDSKDSAINDVAICKISGTIEYSNRVGPVCLPFQHKQQHFANTIVTALGWGMLDFGGQKSNTLQKVNLKTISIQSCKHNYPEINDNNICTFTPGKDACQGDSGGPLIWKNPKTGLYVLAGIISAGVGCASDEPAVAMRVGAYIDWIQHSTLGSQYCKVE